MSMQELIDLLMNPAVLIGEVLDLSSLTVSYKALARTLHPDICKDPRAGEAMSKLNQLKTEYERGTLYNDAVGQFTSNGYKGLYLGGLYDYYADSGSWYSLFKYRGSDNFRKYLPDHIAISSDRMNVKFKERVVCLSGKTLSQEHVNWILSRLLEFSLMMADMGYAHCGINPESVFVVPETHGIIIPTFYHTTKLGNKVQTIDGAYKSWYPADLFKNKIATEVIDMELSKRLAVKLLGDASGLGTSLRKTHNNAFLDFVLTRHTNPLQAYEQYRAMLGRNFEKKFHVLNL